MQLTPSFVLILGILFQITLDAYAIPLTREQMGVVKLPLKRTPMRSDLHPQMVRPLSCLSKVYCDKMEQLFQMHNARAQRRLARMTGRAMKEVDQLTVRGTARIGLPGAKLGSNNDLNVPSTCAFLSFVPTVLSLRTVCPVERLLPLTLPLTRLLMASAPQMLKLWRTTPLLPPIRPRLQTQSGLTTRPMMWAILRPSRWAPLLVTSNS
jgi:hypothetical protein